MSRSTPSAHARSWSTPNFQPLLKYICKVGFEHHCAMSAVQTADAVADAFETYLGWEVYRHQ